MGRGMLKGQTDINIGKVMSVTYKTIFDIFTKKKIFMMQVHEYENMLILEKWEKIVPFHTSYEFVTVINEKMVKFSRELEKE